MKQQLLKKMTYKEKSSSQRAKEEAQHRLKARESIIFASGNEIIAIEARKHVVFGHTICRVVTATVDGKENDTILNMSSEDALKTGLDLIKNYPEYTHQKSQPVSDISLLIIKEERKNTPNIGYIEKKINEITCLNNISKIQSEIKNKKYKPN